MNEIILKTTENDEIRFYGSPNPNADIKSFKINYDNYFLNRMRVKRRKFKVEL